MSQTPSQDTRQSGFEEHDSLDDFGTPEELSFGSNARAPKDRKSLPTIAVCLLLILAIVVCGVGGWALWWFRLRTIPIYVDGQQLNVSASTSLGKLLDDHNDFDRDGGRMLAVDGSVLNNFGGEEISVSVNGTPVNPSQFYKTMLPADAVVTVSPGKDVTEEYTVEQRKVPHGTNINLNDGPVQIVTQLGEDGIEEYWHGSISGKTVNRGEVQAPKKLTVESFAPRPDSKKVIALTFDDGPSQYSNAILDVLKEKKVKATFFDLGEESLAMPQVEQRMVKEGHQVASHSVSHPYLPNLDRKALRTELTDSFKDIKEACGVKTTVLRAPYGAFGVEQWKDSADLISMNVLWDIDTLDWKRPGADKIAAEVLSNAHNGAIALMHDGGGDRTQTRDALPKIIDGLRQQGYEFVTIDELCKLSNLPQPAVSVDGGTSAHD